jgi:murein DD-endopeptidase MepM/ murein hydrolase activator NlpD
LVPARQSASRQVRRPFFHALIIALAIGTAFYAIFLPSRAFTRANNLPSADSGVLSATSGDQQETLGVVVSTSTAPRAVPAPLSAGFGAGLAALQDDPNLRVSAAGVTSPQVSSAIPASFAGTPTCDTSQSNLYCVYTLLAGDTLSGIAAKFNLQGNEDIEPWQLLVHSNNSEIASEDDVLQIGQKIRIPTQNAVLHTVVVNQTLGDIQDIYGVSYSDIVALSLNGITNANALEIGQELLVPNPKQFAKPAPLPQPAPAPSAGSGAGSGTVNTQPIQTGPSSSAGFIWPASGPISSYFSARHPLGIDIDFHSNPNQPVRAAAAGTVTFAGGNACCSYGYYVVVDHGNGYTSLYAHFSSIAVSVGQPVSQGQVLGAGGRTGYATGNHLHFEVHYNGATIDPMGVLP